MIANSSHIERHSTTRLTLYKLCHKTRERADESSDRSIEKLLLTSKTVLHSMTVKSLSGLAAYIIHKCLLFTCTLQGGIVATLGRYLIISIAEFSQLYLICGAGETLHKYIMICLKTRALLHGEIVNEDTIKRTYYYDS